MYSIEPQHEFFVGIDSDGCVFDTMELKHKECFIPNTIKFYQLQGISKYAREAAEFVNLYSKSRGINRFPALMETLQWLKRRPEVKARGVAIQIPQSLQKWIDNESKLSNRALQVQVNRTDDPDLRKALEWSQAVNEAIAGMVRGVPPFPMVRQSLKQLSGKADMIVVSATPDEALKAEWEEHDIAKYVAAICGQEAGTKQETLGNASQYAANHALMIGDAPGDYDAARKNKCLFFPISPGNEEASWKRLCQEGIGKFLGGEFAGAYEQLLLEEFDRYLPEKPPWPVEE